MVSGILADNDVEGFVQGIIAILESSSWQEFWKQHEVPLRKFDDFRL
jgi:hypothetical protein